MKRGSRGRRGKNVASISRPHLLALFSLRKTLSPAAANQSDKAFILLLINSIHLANQEEALRPELFTVSHMLSDWRTLLSAGPDVRGVRSESVKDAEHSVDIHDLLADAKLSYNKLGDPSRTNAFPSLPHVS